MFDNIGSKLKGLAVGLIAISLIVGIVWLLFSLSKLSDYVDYLKYGDISEYFSHAYNAKEGIIYSIIVIISGIISSFLIYGFGELIERLVNIDCKLNEEHKEYDEEKVKEILKDEMTRAELYEKYKL